MITQHGSDKNHLQCAVPEPFRELRIQLYSLLAILRDMDGAKDLYDVLVLILRPINLFR